MPTTLDTAEDVITSLPISLYFDLLPDAPADLEIVSQTAIEFIQALKEAAFLLSESVEVRVVLRNGEEGSLSLNSFLKVTGLSKLNRSQVMALGLAALIWCGDHTLEWAYDKGLDKVAESVGLTADGGKSDQPLSKAQVAEIRKDVLEMQRSPKVQKHISGMYRHASRDPSIKGIGIRFRHGSAKPETIVPKAAFHDRIVESGSVAYVKETRSVQSIEVVQLVSPVLDPTSTRKWAIISPSDGKISVTMEDKDFISRLNDGTVTTKLHNNLKLAVEITRHEEKRDNDWVVTSRSITKVQRIIPPAGTEELFTVPSGDPEPKSE